MQRILNILNGDATLENFRQTALPGDVLVWREILSEGPVKAPGTDGFFRLRSDYLASLAGASPEDYTRKVVLEYERLHGWHRYEEVDLWFEYDLTDQVNLVFLLDFFHTHPAGTALYLICPAEVPGYPDFRGIGELSPQDLEKLKGTRTRLTQEDLMVGARAWQAYRSGSEAEIRSAIAGDTGSLLWLKPAFEAHLERFPGPDGLDRIDRELLRIAGSGVRNRDEIYRIFSAANRIYGMTDLSVDARLNSLEERGLIPGG